MKTCRSISKNRQASAEVYLAFEVQWRRGFARYYKKYLSL